MNEAPWWGVPVVAGVFTIVGVAISQLASYVSDKRRVAREDRQRWHRDMRDACSEYLLAVKLANRATANYPEMTRDVRPDVDGIVDALGDSLTQLEMVAPKDDAGLALLRAVLQPQKGDSVHHARTAFLNAVRTHMGVGLIDNVTWPTGTAR